MLGAFEDALDKGCRFRPGVAHVDRVHLHPERRRHGLDGGKLAGSGPLGGKKEWRQARVREVRRGIRIECRIVIAQTKLPPLQAAGKLLSSRLPCDEGVSSITDITKKLESVNAF